MMVSAVQCSAVQLQLHPAGCGGCRQAGRELWTSAMLHLQPTPLRSTPSGKLWEYFVYTQTRLAHIPYQSVMKVGSAGVMRVRGAVGGLGGLAAWTDLPHPLSMPLSNELPPYAALHCTTPPATADGRRCGHHPAPPGCCAAQPDPRPRRRL